MCEFLPSVFRPAFCNHQHPEIGGLLISISSKHTQVTAIKEDEWIQYKIKPTGFQAGQGCLWEERTRTTQETTSARAHWGASTQETTWPTKGEQKQGHYKGKESYCNTCKETSRPTQKIGERWRRGQHFPGVIRRGAVKIRLLILPHNSVFLSLFKFWDWGRKKESSPLSHPHKPQRS